MIAIPVTLVSAAAAFFVNVWLGWRIAKFRQQFKVSVGDGGHEPLLRRMRAQANFIENAPFFLILLAALEISAASRPLLAGIALVFLIGRIIHAIGMESSEMRRWRTAGMMATTFTMLAVALWAIARAMEMA
jgi:uncharacterized membrane protein YecN with MAPEG domain